MTDPAPPRRWPTLLWGAIAPGLGHARLGAWVAGLAFALPVWGLVLFLAGASHRFLHRPRVLLFLAGLLVGVWLGGLLHLRRRASEASAPPRLSFLPCLGLTLLQLGVLVSLLLPPGIALIPTVPDLIEHHPTDQNAVSGAGGLTAGLSRSGVLTLLRWPGPAGRDHVDWRAVPDRPAGHGADDAMGVFAGVRVDDATHWFRDAATWRTTQRYASDTCDVVVTEHVSASLGLTATETVFVHPERDVLVWRVALTRAAAGPARARVVWFENLAPCTTKLPYLALSDWAFDDRNDFAAAHHERDDLLVHFRPRAERGLPDAPADVDAWIDDLDAAFGPGVYLALGIEGGSSWAAVAADPDGDPGPVLRQASDTPRRFAGAPAVGLLGRDLDLSSTGSAAAATLYLAAGARLDGEAGARTRLQAARTRGFVQLHRQARELSAAWLAGATLPTTDDPHVLRLARRSLLAIRNACDRPSGAIVASVAAQLPYALDWARDGAFLNLALDEAGFPGLVTRHNAYYVKVQRKGGLLAGTYPMNTYEDGTPGGPIFLELDNAALAVWTLADHARFLEGAARDDYLADAAPAIRRGAEFLVRWRDPFTHLPLPAHEDDNPALRRGIQGAVSAILALRAAAPHAPDEAAAARYAARRTELERALFARFWDAGAQRLRDHGPKELDASAWALWPCRVFPPDDPRAVAQGEYLWTELSRTLSGAKARSGYDAKLFLALAELWPPGHPRRPKLVEAYRRFARALPTPDTGLLGEHCRITKGADGLVRYENLNDMPHVWEHALHYLTILRLFPPAR